VKAIVFDAPGDEEVLCWGDAPEPVAGDDQVVVRAVSTSVNRADLLQRRGFYPAPAGASPILGLEVAGEIVEVGRDVTDWSPGDPVMALVPGGGYGSLVAVDAGHLMPIPTAVGLPDAGAVPEVFLTAALNLFDIGRLSSGERVLVHGGSGGVGTAAIQLAAAAGAEVWTTAGGPDRCQRCLDLGAHRAIDHRGEDFGPPLGQAGGANLILDIMGAKYLHANMKALAADGRMVIIGLQGGVKAEINLGLALARRLSITGSTLRALPSDRKSALVERFRAAWWPALSSGDIAPVIDRRLPIQSAAEAHRLMAEGAQFGKLLLCFP